METYDSRKIKRSQINQQVTGKDGKNMPIQLRKRGNILKSDYILDQSNSEHANVTTPFSQNASVSAAKTVTNTT